MLFAFLAITLAAPPDMTDGGTLVLEEGQQKVVHIRGIQRIAVTNAGCWDAKPIGNDDLLLIGGPAGCMVTVLIWRSNGERTSILLKMVAHTSTPVPVSVRTREEEALMIDGSGQRATSVTVVEIPEVLSELHEVTALDGRTLYEGLNAAGRRVTVDVTPYVPRRRIIRDRGIADSGALDAGARR